MVDERNVPNNWKAVALIALGSSFGSSALSAVMWNSWFFVALGSAIGAALFSASAGTIIAFRVIERLPKLNQNEFFEAVLEICEDLLKGALSIFGLVMLVSGLLIALMIVLRVVAHFLGVEPPTTEPMWYYWLLPIPLITFGGLSLFLLEEWPK